VETSSKGEKFFESISKLGIYFNCHRLPERSFFFYGKQFPVCARCTGVFIGQLLAIIFLIIIRPTPNYFYIGLTLLFLGIMFIDWFLQFRGILQSTNIRRLITGFIGGIGAIFLYYYLLLIFINLLF
jgi:uncharacterized membrane protein